MEKLGIAGECQYDGCDVWSTVNPMEFDGQLKTYCVNHWIQTLLAWERGDDVSSLKVAGSEPDMLRALGISTNEPEEYGVDYLWRGYDEAMWGVQRKTISDFIASLHDGRLMMELQQGQRLDHPFLVIEGSPAWSTDGELIGNFGPTFTRQQYMGTLLTISVKTKFIVYEVESITAFAQLIKWMERWSEKEEHLSLFRRPKEHSPWGTADAKDFQAFLLQSIPGVGLKTAQAIVQHIGFPIQLSVSREQLLTVPGIGEKTADAIIRATTPDRTKGRRKRRKNSV